MSNYTAAWNDTMQTYAIQVSQGRESIPVAFIGKTEDDSPISRKELAENLASILNGNDQLPYKIPTDAGTLRFQRHSQGGDFYLQEEQGTSRRITGLTVNGSETIADLTEAFLLKVTPNLLSDFCASVNQPSQTPPSSEVRMAPN